MTASLSRLVPRRGADKTMPIRTSDRVRLDIAASEQEAQDAIAEGLRLNSRTKAILLSGNDAAHERHEADIARLRRIVARCEARQEELSAELQDVEAQQAEEAKIQGRTDATAQAEAAVRLLDEVYGPARKAIMDFLPVWIEAVAAAKRAGVPTPEDLARFRPGFEGIPTPPSQYYVDKWIDQRGVELTSAVMVVDPETGENRPIDAVRTGSSMRPVWLSGARKVRERRMSSGGVEGAYPAKRLPSLAESLTLPEPRVE